VLTRVQETRGVGVPETLQYRVTFPPFCTLVLFFKDSIDAGTIKQDYRNLFLSCIINALSLNEMRFQRTMIVVYPSPNKYSVQGVDGGARERENWPFYLHSNTTSENK